MRLAALVLLPALLLGAPSHAEPQWISKEQSALVLDLPGLAGAREIFEYEQAPDYRSETYYAAQIGAGNGYPRAQFYYTILAPGRVRTLFRDMDEAWVREQAPFLEEKQIRMVREVRGGGEEKLRTVRFRVDESDCIGIYLLIGRANTYTYVSAGAPEGSLRGIYCSQSGVTLADSAVNDILGGIHIASVGGDLADHAPPDPGSTAAPVISAERSFPMALVWDGFPNPMIGTVSFKDDEKGESSLTLSTKERQCQGFWRKTEARAVVSGDGFWTIQCADGLGATGTYKSSEAGQGAGAGLDSMGRQVRFRYGQ